VEGIRISIGRDQMVGGSNPSEPVFYTFKGTNIKMNKMKSSKSFSLLNHNLIPQHILLSENETQQVLKQYNIEKEQLPKIKNKDPVIVEIGANVGDVVKIIRKSQTAGEAEFYRLVIE
jgi:DNA-directed RNA polymerase subunit H